MSTWILIMMLGGSGSAIDHIAFDDRNSCEIAVNEYIAHSQWGSSAKAFCVESKHE